MQLAWEDICEEVFLVRSDGAGRELSDLLKRMVGAVEGEVQLSIKSAEKPC